MLIKIRLDDEERWKIRTTQKRFIETLNNALKQWSRPNAWIKNAWAHKIYVYDFGFGASLNRSISLLALKRLKTLLRKPYPVTMPIVYCFNESASPRIWTNDTPRFYTFLPVVEGVASSCIKAEFILENDKQREFLHSLVFHSNGKEMMAILEKKTEDYYLNFFEFTK